jgi:hypothetical protein
MPEPEVDGEFLVNTLTDGDQTDPKIAVLDSGNFVVIWLSKIDDDYYYLKGQLFNHEGLKKGNEFYITTESSKSPYQFTVLSTPAGFFVQWWNKYTYLNTYINALSFDANAYRMASQMQFDTGKNIDYRYVDTALLADNDIITVYCDLNAAVHYMIWDQTARTVYQEGTIVPESAEGYTIFIKVCGLEDGSLVVVWTHLKEASELKNPINLMHQIFKKDGTPVGNPIIIITYPYPSSGWPSAGLYPAIGTVEPGFTPCYLILWVSPFLHRPIAQYFNSSGETLSDQIALELTSSDYRLFKMSRTHIAVVGFGSEVIYNEYLVDHHSISRVTTFNLNQAKEGYFYAGGGIQIFDHTVVVVWYGKYENDYNIYGIISTY